MLIRSEVEEEYKMAIINIDYDGLMQQASAIGGISASYESLNTRLKSLRIKVNDGWEGEASKAFGDMMQKYINQSQHMKEILDLFRSYATDTASSFQEVDQRCAAMIRNSF